jgi:hypothetical protein
MELSVQNVAYDTILMLPLARSKQDIFSEYLLIYVTVTCYYSGGHLFPKFSQLKKKCLV